MSAKACSIIVIVLAALLANAAMAVTPIIGMLEEKPSGDWGSSLQNAVRVGFEKEGSEWVALNCNNSENVASVTCSALSNPEAPVTWTVYYRGKALGTIKSTSWVNSYAKDKGKLAIAPGRVPTIGISSKDFAGWSNASAHRPLIVVNSTVPPFTNRWEKDAPHPELLATAWPSFRSVVSAIDVCAEDSGTVSRYTLSPSDVRPMPGWRSRSGELLLHFGVDPRLQANCEMRFNRDVWLFRSPGGDIRVLPGQVWSDSDAISFTPSLALVDTGDFTGDGDEEAVFFFSGYNFDGYILYYNNFRKAVRFGWNYH